MLTGCAPKSTGDPARDVAENFLYACKKGNQEDILGYSTIGLTDGLKSQGISAEQTLRHAASMRSYEIKRCDMRPELSGEYMALYADTKKFRAASSSSEYGAGVPLFESLDGVCEVEYTAQYDGSNTEAHETMNVISKDGQWAVDAHCLAVMRPRLSEAEIALCNDAAFKTALAANKALSDMKKDGLEIEALEGVQTFTSRALRDAKKPEHSALTQDELFQTLLVKTLQNDESILEMEQFSISVLNGTIKAAVVQNDVYHSENGALNYIGYGTWPHALNAAVEFEANRDRMNLEFAMMLASK